MTGPRRRPAIVALTALALVAVVGVMWGPQLRSYVMHVGGSPTRTRPLDDYLSGEDARLRLAVAGDVGYAGSRGRRTAEAMTAAEDGRNYDALLLLGDNVYPSGDPAGLDQAVFEPYAGVLDDGTALLAVLGNHDVKDGNAEGQVEWLGMPGRWWSRAFGDELLVVGLDSNETDSEVQRTWLENTLRGSTARWRVVTLHHPPYSAGYQGSALDVRAAFSPLFERYGVQLVLAGHEHDYQRSRPIRGVTYVVSGGASDTRRTSREEFTAVAWAWHHFVDIGVYAERMVVRAVNQDGRVFDQASIRP